MDVFHYFDGICKAVVDVDGPGWLSDDVDVILGHLLIGVLP